MENIEVFVRTKAAQLAAQQYQNNFKQVATKQAGVQEVMDSLVESIKSLPPEQQRLLLGAGGGAAVGGLGGAVGAIRNREANRSVIGDSLRGALAGGAIGGGGALAFNVATGGRTGLGGLVPSGEKPDAADTRKPDSLGAVDALDKARRNPDTLLNSIADVTSNNIIPLTAGGAAIGGASDLHDRFGSGPKGERFVAGVRRLADSYPENMPGKENLNRLHVAMQDNPGRVARVMELVDRHSTHTGSFADSATKARLLATDRLNGRPPVVQMGTPPVGGPGRAPDRAIQEIDTMFRPPRQPAPPAPPPQPPAPWAALNNMYNTPGGYGNAAGGAPPSNAPSRFFDPDGMPTADTLRHARRGTGGAKIVAPADQGLLAKGTSYLSRMTGRRAATGAAGGLALGIVPSLLSLIPSREPPASMAEQIARDYGF